MRIAITDKALLALLIRAAAGEDPAALLAPLAVRRKNTGAGVRLSLRAAIWLREGGACVWCGADLSDHGLDLDHLGDRTDSRLHSMVASCPGCNGARARMSWSAFAASRDGAYLTRWGGESPDILMRHLAVHADIHGAALRADGLRLSRGIHELTAAFSAARHSGGTGARESRPGNRP